MTPETETPGAAFAALGLDPRLVSELAELGYEEPTPIQSEAIPPLLAGRDLLGQAATGTGKTAAFALPLLQRLAAEARPGTAPAALVLVPTRELAMQVAEAVHRYGRKLGTVVLPIYGGQSMGQQLRSLKRGVDVVVATPGRALDHVRRGTLPLDAVRVVVLDEADEMLDMGFAEDLEAILEAVPRERQTALFSATMPKRIASIAERHLKGAVRIAIGAEKVAAGALPRIRQVAYMVQRAHKVAALSRVLDMESPTAALVFCRTRNEVDELAETLGGRGYRAEALHGGLSQEQRDRVMRRFRDGTAELLLATDVAARGLDIEHLTHVINFDVPSAPEAYVHRIGRTGRAGREGAAITLAQPREQHLLRNIEQLTRQKIQIRTVPTIADLRARRLEVTRASVLAALAAGGLEPFRAVVDALEADHALADVAAAAIKMAHEACGDGGGEEEAEIPQAAAAPERPAPRKPSKAAPHRKGRGEEASTPARRPFAASRPARGAAERAKPERPAPAAKRAPAEVGVASTLLYIAAGKQAGIRPGDLVGAITNEANVEAKAIGAIQIEERFSIVEVRETAAEQILEALKRTTLKGRKVTASRYRAPGKR